jgi:hypothetical protein
MELLKYYNNYIKQIIIIQKNIRKYIIKKNILIPKSLYQTKIWRKNRLWYKNGKYNECEKYQISIIEKIINLNLRRTDERINIENNSIINNKNPLINNDGYEWTENFDGKIIKNNNIYYFNLKFVCDFGGAQNRTLREIYHFIKYQMEYLLNNNNNIYFINILDGDNSYHNINKFNYLKNNEKYKNNIKNIFIGSLYDFQKNKYIYNL